MGVKHRRVRSLGMAVVGACAGVAACSGEATAPLDAGVVSNGLDAETLRRSLHADRPRALVAPRTKGLPFAQLTPSPAPLVPGVAPWRDAIVAPPAAAGPSTFLLPSVISPTPDRSGRYVMRRRDSSTFFTLNGLAFALSAGGRDGRGWGLHCTLVGAREGALVPEAQQAALVHNYVGPESAWAIDLPTYGRLAWEQIYPGVDMVAEPVRGGIAYRFVLSPGAKLSDVVMRWDGATSVKSADDARGVDVETGIGVLRVRGLRAFVAEGHQRTELVARHVVRGTAVALEVPGWDGLRPLVVDPTIEWSSYLGGSGTEGASGIAVDTSGNAFVTGETRSTDFPTTGGFDTTTTGVWFDAFVTKLSGSGALLWSSYLGGAAGDYGQGVATDSSGNTFVTGFTRSTDFPTTGGFDTTFGGGSSDEDAFVTKVSGSGALLWSSFLGGALLDRGRSVAVDSSGSAFVTGVTGSTDFPTTGGFDATNNASDAFVTKVSGSGTLLWSSFLGGASNDAGFSIAVDAAGNAFVTGLTLSTDFPTTGGFDTTFGGGGNDDAFVTKVSGSGALLWSSFLGGSGADSGYGIAADSSGNVFVTGYTASTYFPATGGFAATLGGGDAFVTKVTGSGTLLWSSFLGGAGYLDWGYGIGLDPSENAVITGYTYSSDFPTTGGFDATFDGGGKYDAFVTRVSGSGALLASSFLGGSREDVGFGVAIDSSGNTFVVGTTESTDFPTPGGFDTTSGGGEAFVTRIRQLPLGKLCAVAFDCVSAICVDGVCCDKACTGACEACTAAKKGGGADGACGNVAAGTDPKDKCTADPTPLSCDGDGMCDGVGACRLYAPKGKACGSTSCEGGSVSGSTCNGSGSCEKTSTTCAPYACGSGACKTTCTSDADCSADAYCTTANTCAAKHKTGAACGDGRECEKGFCVDGVCCESACSGQCEACNEPSTAGKCVSIAGGPRGKRPGCAGDPAVCGGICDGTNPASCKYAPVTKPCGSTCASGEETASSCDGMGACVGKTRACSPYACADDKICAATCSTALPCAAGYACSGGECVPANASACSADGSASTSKDGIVTSCGAYLCNPSTGTCRQLCAGDTDCASGNVCGTNRTCSNGAGATADEASCACESAPGHARSTRSFALAMFAGVAMFAANHRRTVRGGASSRR